MTRKRNIGGGRKEVRKGWKYMTREESEMLGNRHTFAGREVRKGELKKYST